VTAGPLASAEQIGSRVTIDYDIASLAITGRVDSPNSNCEKNRKVSVVTDTGETVATTRTAADGSYGVAGTAVGYGRFYVEHAFMDPESPRLVARAEQKTFKRKRKKKKSKCKAVSSRPQPVYDNNLNCHANTLQHPSLRDEDTFGVQCPVQVSKVGEVALAPITKFQNPGVAVAPPRDAGLPTNPRRADLAELGRIHPVAAGRSQLGLHQRPTGLARWDARLDGRHHA
jgi:hypothetical protein